jgi:hypothetical protein
MRGRAHLIAAVVLLVGPLASAQPLDPPDPSRPWSPPLVPASEPFSLGAYDVIDAVWLIRRARFLQYWDYERAPETIVARSVESYWVDFDPNAYEGHQNRYSILLNGEPIDWDHLYVEYAGDMINLRLLYTYRNQKPPPEVPYRLRWP